MSVAEMAQVIGRTGSLSVVPSSTAEVWGGGWLVPCVVTDVRRVWGRLDYQVSPVGFDGGAVWVESVRVRLGGE